MPKSTSVNITTYLEYCTRNLYECISFNWDCSTSFRSVVVRIVRCIEPPLSISFVIPWAAKQRSRKVPTSSSPFSWSAIFCMRICSNFGFVYDPKQHFVFRLRGYLCELQEFKDINNLDKNDIAYFALFIRRCGAPGMLQIGKNFSCRISNGMSCSRASNCSWYPSPLRQKLCSSPSDNPGLYASRIRRILPLRCDFSRFDRGFDKVYRFLELATRNYFGAHYFDIF